MHCSLQVVLFDVQQRTAVAELNCPFLKYAVWSSDMGQVALLSKHAILIADKRLQNSCTGEPERQTCSSGSINVGCMGPCWVLETPL